MQIIYEYLATDGETHTTSLSSYLVSYTLYPTSFVADNSKLASWELDGKIWK